MEEVKVSIIVMAGPEASLVERAVGSALRQTLHGIQAVVAFNDSHTATMTTCERLAAEDGRVVPLALPAETSSFSALRTAVAQANGAFALLLDPADELAPDAAERLCEAQGGRFDIVQCALEPRYTGFASDDERAADRALCHPPASSAEGDGITRALFRSHKTSWNLYGKLIRTALLEEALRALPSEPPANTGAGVVADASTCARSALRMPLVLQAEQACALFIASCRAGAYRGLGSFKGYRCNINDNGGSREATWSADDPLLSGASPASGGASGSNLPTAEASESNADPDARLSDALQRFSANCHAAAVLAAIRSYLDENDHDTALLPEYLAVRHEFARLAAEELLGRIPRYERGAAYDLLASAWSPEEAAAALAQAGWDDPAACFEDVADARTLSCPAREMHTVGAYHYRMGIGGAERVAAELVNVWHDAGLRVVFFADEPREACGYPLPPNVEWVQLPATDAVGRDGYLQRAQAIAHAVRDFHVDAFVNHQWWNALLAWDSILVKSLGVPVCLYCHNIFKVMFYETNVREYDHAKILRHLDGLVVMSEADKRFWSKFNPRVWLTCNPVTLPPNPAQRASLAGKNIVWVGRLSNCDKQPQEAIEVFARVAPYEPESTLTLVGPAESKRYLASLKALARRLGVEKRVIFAGPQQDPAPFLRRAAVHLLTSRLDGWCLVLAESKALGVPCVMYEMDYLTLAEGHRGLISVPQGDRDAAAQAVLELLRNDELRERLGQEAFDHISEISSFDLARFWNQVFAGLSHGSPTRDGFAAFDAEWDVLVDGFKISLGKALNLPVTSFAKRKGLKAARALSRRLGRE